MKLNLMYGQYWFRLVLAASLAAGLLAVHPDFWLFRYPTKVGSVLMTYNVSAILLLVLWFLIAIRLNWLSRTIRSVILGLIGGYLAYFPAAIIAEATFRGNFDFIFGDATLIGKMPAAVLVLLVTPLLCGTFLLGGIFGFATSFRQHIDERRS